MEMANVDTQARVVMALEREACGHVSPRSLRPIPCPLKIGAIKLFPLMVFMSLN